MLALVDRSMLVRKTHYLTTGSSLVKDSTFFQKLVQPVPHGFRNLKPLVHGQKKGGSMVLTSSQGLFSVLQRGQRKLGTFWQESTPSTKVQGDISPWSIGVQHIIFNFESVNPTQNLQKIISSITDSHSVVTPVKR